MEKWNIDTTELSTSSVNILNTLEWLGIDADLIEQHAMLERLLSESEILSIFGGNGWEIEIPTEAITNEMRREIEFLEGISLEKMKITTHLNYEMYFVEIRIVPSCSLMIQELVLNHLINMGICNAVPNYHKISMHWNFSATKFLKNVDMDNQSGVEDLGIILPFHILTNVSGRRMQMKKNPKLWDLKNANQMFPHSSKIRVENKSAEFEYNQFSLQPAFNLKMLLACWNAYHNSQASGFHSELEYYIAALYPKIKEDILTCISNYFPSFYADILSKPSLVGLETTRNSVVDRDDAQIQKNLIELESGLARQVYNVLHELKLAYHLFDIPAY